MILDSYLVRAISKVTSRRLYDAHTKLYGVDSRHEMEDLNDLEIWLNKAREKPGLALSSAGAGSFRGRATCSLLEVLGSVLPKARRVRQAIAWEILSSAEGRAEIGPTPALDAALAAWHAKSSTSDGDVPQQLRSAEF